MQSIKIFIVSLCLAGLIFSACGGGKKSSSSDNDTVTFTGTVGASTEPTLKKSIRFQTITEGDCAIYNAAGDEVATCSIDSDGSYSCEANVDDVADQTVFIEATYTATNEAGDEMTGTYSSHEVVATPSDGDSIEEDVNPTTSIVVAGLMEACTHVEAECGPGVDSEAAEESVNMEVAGLLFAALTSEYTVGEDDTDVDTAGADMAAIVEAAGNVTANEDGANIAELFYDALTGDATASNTIDAAGLVGGGINLTDAASAVADAIANIVESFADPSNEDAVTAWAACEASSECLDNPIPFAGLVGDMAPGDLTALLADDPTVFLNYANAIFGDSTITLADFQSPEVRQAAAQQILLGGAATLASARVQLAVLYATLPEAADGVRDFSSYVPAVAGRAACNVGFETYAGLGGTIITAEQAVASYGATLRESGFQSNFALFGTLGNTSFVNSFISSPGTAVSNSSLLPGPNQTCTSSCIPGSECVTQSSGSKYCIISDTNIGISCSSDPTVCTGATVCGGTGTAALCVPAGGLATGTVVLSGSSGTRQIAGTDYTLPTSGVGSTCSSTCSGGTCTGGLCVADNTCKAPGAGCSANANCCSGTCTSNFCANGTTGTAGSGTDGSDCTFPSDCIPGKSCVAGTCQTFSSSSSGSSTSTTTTTSSYTVSVTISGTGGVTASGLTCTSATACSGSYTSGATVVLTATASSGFSFSAWAGSCSGSSSTCTLTVDAAKSVSATFAAAIPQITDCNGKAFTLQFKMNNDPYADPQMPSPNQTLTCTSSSCAGPGTDPNNANFVVNSNNTCGAGYFAGTDPAEDLCSTCTPSVTASCGTGTSFTFETCATPGLIWKLTR